MKIIITSLVTLALSSTLSFADITYYKSNKGEFTNVEPTGDTGGESFSITKSKSGKIIEAKRNFHGCGTWGLSLTYKYGHNGKLVEIVSSFYTTHGIVDSNSEFIPTTCEEVFKVEGREIKLISTKILDAKTEKPVTRSLPERPLIGHWANVSEIPAVTG